MSQIKTSLRHRLEKALRMDRGRARTNLLETIKTTVLQELDADRGSMINVEIEAKPPKHTRSTMSPTSAL